LPCPPHEQQTILLALQNAFADHSINLVDGVRIIFEDGWALVRPSVTEPLLTMRFEGHTEARLQEIQAEVIRRVPAWRQLLGK
jgi:phosphomannomutase/phosphoglucomutase